VSAEAGFSTGAVYSNFGGKEELFLSIYEERIQRRRRELRAAIERAGGGREGIASAASDVGKVFHEERDWFLLYFDFALHAARNPTFASRFKAVRDEGLAELADSLAAGLERAGVDPSISADELAQAIRALWVGA
jgi:AcrR family transcriptional regulator